MATYTFDVFLSYAVEDKIELASELCQKLEQRGLNVWYAGRELTPGESIEKTIRDGLDQSRFGIVLITPTYFERNWTIKELYTLMSRETSGEKVIIPVFHKITEKEVAKYDIVLSDRWALKTSDGLDKVSEEIVKRVNQDKLESNANLKRRSWPRWIILSIALILIAGFIFNYFMSSEDQPSMDELEKVITDRVTQFNESITDELASIKIQNDLKAIDKEAVSATFQSFNDLERQYRNYYRFTNGISAFQFKKHVVPASGFDFEASSSINDYGFDYPNIYVAEKNLTSPYFHKEFFYFNTQPVVFNIDELADQDSLVLVSVTYQEHLRFLSVLIEYSPSTSDRKHTTYSLKGLLPTEIFVFKKDSRGWVFSHIQ